MQKMYRVNDMGVSYEVDIVAYKGEYVIYTDFTTDSNGELSLYVGKNHNQELLDVSLEESNTILNEFKELENNHFGLEKKGDFYEL